MLANSKFVSHKHIARIIYGPLFARSRANILIIVKSPRERDEWSRQNQQEATFTFGTEQFGSPPPN